MSLNIPVCSLSLSIGSSHSTYWYTFILPMAVYLYVVHCTVLVWGYILFVKSLVVVSGSHRFNRSRLEFVEVDTVMVCSHLIARSSTSICMMSHCKEDIRKLQVNMKLKTDIFQLVFTLLLQAIDHANSYTTNTLPVETVAC